MHNPVIQFDRHEDLVELVALAHHTLLESIRAQIAGQGLSPIEWRILAALSRHDGVPVSELVRSLVVQQPTLTKAIDRMERARLVQRRTPSEDRRRTLVNLTERGARIAAPLLSNVRAREAAIARAMGADAAGKLRAELTHLIDLVRLMPRWAMREHGDNVAVLPTRTRSRG